MTGHFPTGGAAQVQFGVCFTRASQPARQSPAVAAKRASHIGRLLVILALIGANAPAETEIYRCSMEDGTIAFQEMPCPEPAADKDEAADESPAQQSTAAETDDVFDFVNPFDEPETPSAPAATAQPEPVSQTRAECEKDTRDAIDEIDLEMRSDAYTRDEGQVYMARLRELTQRLRACKRM